jgi:hypothetical protein
MNYDLIVDVFRTDKSCKVLHFQVWNRFGDMSLTLSEELHDECGSV